MVYERAIVRTPAPNFALGLTTAQTGPPHYDLILQQHQAYISALRRLGLGVEILPPLADFPDAYFVEDVAVVTPETAIITNPGAAARNGEQVHIEAALQKHRRLAHINFPGTLDGGDVLQVGEHFFIGISQRTNEDGAGQLGRLLEDEGYGWTPIYVSGGLHLKSDISAVGRGTLLLSASLAELSAFAPYEKILVNREEAYAANSLLINGRVLTPKGFSATKEKLLGAGFEIIELEMSEVQKMDGGLSCLSLRF